MCIWTMVGVASAALHPTNKKLGINFLFPLSLRLKILC